MLNETIGMLEDYCDEFATDYDLESAARHILFDLNETFESIDGDTLNEVLQQFDISGK